MPQNLLAGGLLKMRVWCLFPTEVQASVNTNHYFISAVGGTPATDEDAAVALDNLLTVSMPPVLTNLSEYRGVQAQILSPIPPFPALYVEAFSIAGATVGTGGAFALPTQTTGLFSYLTAGAGPRGRGRCFVPFPAQQADSGGGTPDPAYVTKVDTLASDMKAGLNISTGGRTATLVRVLLHGKDKDGNQIVPFWTPVLDHKTSIYWATQRRRGVFGASNKSPI